MTKRDHTQNFNKDDFARKANEEIYFENGFLILILGNQNYPSILVRYPNVFFTLMVPSNGVSGI